MHSSGQLTRTPSGSEDSALFDRLRYGPVGRWIQRVSGLATGRLLDFGCGDGAFMRYMRRRSWDACGIDPAAAEDAPCPGIHASLHAVTAPFDVVTSHFSLEHCQNPQATLQRLYSMLVEKGRLFVRVPNQAAVSAHPRLAAFQATRAGHLHTFTPQSLRDLLQTAGFASVRTDTRLSSTTLITPSCSLFPALDPMTWLSAPPSPAGTAKAGALALLSLLFLPFSVFQSAKGNGAAIFASALKAGT